MGLEIKLETPKAIAVELEGAQVSLGARDHSILENRDAENQHPIQAITDLENQLGKKVGTEDFLTNTEIKELLGW